MLNKKDIVRRFSRSGQNDFAIVHDVFKQRVSVIVLNDKSRETFFVHDPNATGWRLYRRHKAKVKPN